MKDHPSALVFISYFTKTWQAGTKSFPIFLQPYFEGREHLFGVVENSSVFSRVLGYTKFSINRDLVLD